MGSTKEVRFRILVPVRLTVAPGADADAHAKEFAKHLAQGFESELHQGQASIKSIRCTIRGRPKRGFSGLAEVALTVVLHVVLAFGAAFVIEAVPAGKRRRAENARKRKVDALSRQVGELSAQMEVLRCLAIRALRRARGTYDAKPTDLINLEIDEDETCGDKRKRPTRKDDDPPKPSQGGC